MSKKVVTPFVRVPSPEEKADTMSSSKWRQKASFPTPRSENTPTHAGPAIAMHTPTTSEREDFPYHLRFKGIDEIVELSHDSIEPLKSTTAEALNLYLWQPSKKAKAVLTPFNFFRNARTEESYQLDVSQQSITHSQLVLFLLVVSRIAVAVWWYYTKEQDALVGFQLIAEDYTDVFHWAFLPFAFAAMLPFHWFSSWGKTKLFAYWVRRYWKYIVMCVLVLFCMGYLIYYTKVHAASKTAFQKKHEVTKCGNTVPIPDSYNGHGDVKNSTYVWVDAFTTGLLDYTFNMFIINDMATALVLCMTLKLDFPQVLVVLGSCFLFYVIDWVFQPPHNDLYRTANFYVFGFAIFIPFVSGLTAFYFIDRDARMVFYEQSDAERVNTALKHGVTVNRLQYQNRGHVGPFEEQLLQELLAKTPENALIHNVSIPFEDLTLDELITEHAKGDTVRGKYTGLRVAIKRLSVITRESVADFKSQVELLACLRHPNVVQFIGASFDSLTNLCIVMEYVEKGNVYNLLRTPMALEWNDPLLQIAIDAAQGVAYLHHSNVIHRDLKSENLLCTATYACKVSDFGESKQVQTQEYLNSMVGTPYWLAPEILRETPYQNKVDCYSFGIVLLELESRRDPYFDCEDMSTIDIMVQVAMGTLRPSIPATCTPRRRALIEQCLSDNPLERPSMVSILKTLQTEVRDEVLASRINMTDPQLSRRQLLHTHQMLNRRGLHEVLANDRLI
ncbi:hypothetical protein AC1031_003728 [Aphanomyces cochlioides]|nr:hypothetical protein AC1031_003728 [Aphanomyces cochlioides]